MRRSQWPFSRMSLLISSFRSRILPGLVLVFFGGGGRLRARARRARHATASAPPRRARERPLSPFAACAPRAPVLAEARVLDLHDLLPDLAEDLLPPLVGLVQVAALGGEVRPPLLGAALVRLLARQEAVEHRLRLLRVSSHGCCCFWALPGGLGGLVRGVGCCPRSLAPEPPVLSD